ncbi:MAG: dihydroorotate dehydrogenase electron transfer subunit [Pseudomonadota bacterium]
MSVDRSHRGSICLEDCEVISQSNYPGEQYVLRVRAPQCAERARAGSFAHIRCGEDLPMRRPLSIMRVSKEHGWVEFLYKIVGLGLADLARVQRGDTLSILGPIGQPFVLRPEKPRPLLLGGGVGIPPMVFVADESRELPDVHPLVLMGSEIPFPFDTRPSQIMVDGIPSEAIACMPLLDSWGVASRLASLSDFAGCYNGFVTDLARSWLQNLTQDALESVEILACGPGPMLAAAIHLAKEYDLPCQVSLEEYMACAVGGCAGCTVLVSTPEGDAMKRVCVDGPVFDGHQIHPGALTL